jgi:hypothetical protein
MFEKLIQETEKEIRKLYICPKCKMVMNLTGGVLFCDCGGVNAFDLFTDAELKGRIEAYKQCQTIAEGNIKTAKDLLDDCMSGGCDREMVLKQFDDIFKQQLNPAQTEDD